MLLVEFSLYLASKSWGSVRGEGLLGSGFEKMKKKSEKLVSLKDTLVR